METLKEMKTRHRQEIANLQNSCKHNQSHQVLAELEKRLVCDHCGKIIKRVRGEIFFKG